MDAGKLLPVTTVTRSGKTTKLNLRPGPKSLELIRLWVSSRAVGNSSGPLQTLNGDNIYSRGRLWLPSGLAIKARLIARRRRAGRLDTLNRTVPVRRFVLARTLALPNDHPANGAGSESDAARPCAGRHSALPPGPARDVWADNNERGTSRTLASPLQSGSAPGARRRNPAAPGIRGRAHARRRDGHGSSRRPSLLWSATPGQGVRRQGLGRRPCWLPFPVSGRGIEWLA